jgi:hypothetical protein
VNRIEQSYTLLPKPKSKTRPQQTKTTPTKTVATPAQPTESSLETSGTTGGYFAYEQALNLSQTSAENRAHSMCRNGHNGRLKSSSSNIVKKNYQ